MSYAAITNLARQAKAAGMPQEQLERFIAARYVPQPHQLPWHAAARLADHPDGPQWIALGGARGPGKTFAMVCQSSLDDCQRYPGLKVLFLRKILKAGRESFEDTLKKALAYTNHKYTRFDGRITFPNGSYIKLGHYKSDSEIDAFLGQEYDVIIVEEATQLAENRIEAIRGSLRTSKKGWRPRMYLTFNPGGIGHSWVKRRIITPWRDGTQKETLFLPANANNNAYLDAGYKEWLNNLGGTLGRMWRDGDWDALAGQYFDNWNHERHVIDPIPPSELHADWRFWGSLDYGYIHYNVFYLIGMYNGHVYLLDEVADRGKIPAENMVNIRAMLARYNLEPDQLLSLEAGHDLWTTRPDGTKVAEQYQALGFNIQPADTNRVAGAQAFIDGLGGRTGNGQWLYITRNCHGLVATLPILESDPALPERVKKWDISGDGDLLEGDDFFDAARYGIMAKDKHGRNNIASVWSYEQ